MFRDYLADSLASYRVIVDPKNIEMPDSSFLVAIRRHLHRNPELSGREFNTTRFLAAELESLGIPYSLGPENRGLVVDLGNPNAERRLAIRADIDAIAVSDVKQVEYRSLVDSVMHACGHDAHSSILLGTVKALHKYIDVQPTEHAIRAIFQPEEETATGAQRMIQFGVLEGVTSIIAAHVDPSRPVGKIALRPGVVTAHCNEISIDIIGKGGHAARPHETVDPIELAVEFISACYEAVPRYEQSEHPVVLSFTAIQGGEQSNVIPEKVRLLGTMRSLEQTTRERAIAKVHEFAKELGEEKGAEIQVNFGLVVPSVLADESLTGFVREVGSDVLGAENVLEIPEPSMGGEDFAFYSQQLPASLVRLGCRGEKTGGLPLHNSGFDIDEGVLPVGMQVMTSVATRFLNQKDSSIDSNLNR